MEGFSQQAVCKKTLTTRILHWTPVFLILFTAIWSYYTYTYEFCMNVVTNYLQKLIYLTVFHLLMLLYLFTYCRAITKKVAVPPEQFVLPQDYLEEFATAPNDESRTEILNRFVRQYNLPIQMRNENGGYVYCAKCFAIKPDRAHHCSACQRCVLKMDHHCPWLNTCVSFANYKFFLLILMYGLALCSFTFCSILPFYVMFFMGDNSMGGNPRNDAFSRFNVLFLFFVSGLFAMPVMGMVFDHANLSMRNRTTIETLQTLRFADGVAEDAYDMGSGENLRQVFGTSCILWLLPVFSSLGDGVVYPRKSLEAL